MAKHETSKLSLPSLSKQNSSEMDKSPKETKLRTRRLGERRILMKHQTKVAMIESMLVERNTHDVEDQHKERQIQLFLRETKLYMEDQVEKVKILNSSEGHSRYYQKYKNLDKIRSRKKTVGETNFPSIENEDDPFTKIFEEVETQGVLPCSMGFTKDIQGQIRIISVKGQKFGDKYVKAISAGLKLSNLEVCEFSGNRLSDTGFDEIINNISNDIIKLDFSQNTITKISDSLLHKIASPSAKLQYLNLQNNLLSDRSVQALCLSATLSRNLKLLNLRKNLLTKQCAEGFEELLLRSISLQQLYIGLNKINEEGAIRILECLQDNRKVKVFDYCMNGLGQAKVSCASAFANVIKRNKNLRHVDLSGNRFSEQQSKIISKSLQTNRSIYGFHFNGNHGYVNAEGFLKMQRCRVPSLHTIVPKHINGYQIVFRREVASTQLSHNVCWICEGWHEQLFKFTVPQAERGLSKYLVYIHFDFQQYCPRAIESLYPEVQYRCMVPPRKYRYFFTFNSQQYLDQQQQKQQIQTVKIQAPLTYNYQVNGKIISFKVIEASSRCQKPMKIVDENNQLIVSVQPRHRPEHLKTKRIKIWNYSESVWAKQWKLQDERLTKCCFEKDWQNSKLSKLIKNVGEQQKVKQLLLKHYKLIKELYRFYASWSPFNGDIWAVSSNAFTQFCHEANIISKEAPLKIIDLTFITTNSISRVEYMDNPLVPERGQVRFQFMEAIVRLAEEKYKKTGISNSICSSVFNILKENIKPLEGKSICSSQKWRIQTYFNEKIDFLIKKYRPIFSDLYKRNSKMKIKPGCKPFMCLAEFKDIMDKAKLAGTLILQRDIFLNFNCSMMTQINQITEQRFMHMSEIQFIEAVARCAYGLPDSYCQQQNSQNSSSFPAKFEWIIQELKNLCSQEIKYNFSSSMKGFKSDSDDE